MAEDSENGDIFTGLATKHEQIRGTETEQSWFYLTSNDTKSPSDKPPGL
jgi:hypothetical protein